MGAIVTDSDYSYLQSVYPLAGVKPLTGQQEQFLLHYLRGQSVLAAERAAGYAVGRGRELLNQPHFVCILDYMRQKEFADARISRETLTGMLFEAHAKSANATEEIAAIREIGKMHGLYESDNQRATRVEVNIDKRIQNVNNIRQIERLTEDELLKLAGNTVTLDPADYEITEPCLIERDSEN